MRPPVDQVLVVVPAHDEEEWIADCLRALAVAAARVDVPVRVLVVCDDCQDRTADICAAQGVPALSIHAHSVGIARRRGIAEGLKDLGQLARVWIANTDADSLVPASWLVDQLRLANLGADAVVGLVSLRRGTDPAVSDAFEWAYAQGQRADGTHAHVHGANLGVRASAYLSAGGFATTENHEDRWLLHALEQRNHHVVRPDWLVVETSGRFTGRCTQGFAADLSQLRRRVTTDSPCLEVV